MKFLRMLTAGMLAVSMSFAAVSAEIRQSTLTVAAAETPDAALLKEYAEVIVNQVNDARLNYKDPENPSLQLSELALLPVMCDYAQVRAQELPLEFGHNRPVQDENGNLITSNIQYDADGNMLYNDNGTIRAKNCFTVIKEDGFWYSSAAENIAAGNALPVNTFIQWLNSDSHRRNMMGNFTHIGIGYYQKPGSTYTYYWSMFLVGVWDEYGNPKVFDGQYIPERDFGDVDGSKRIDSTDVSRILQYTSQMNAGLPVRMTDAFRKASDLNEDGSVNAVDASILLSYIAESGANPDAKIKDFVW